MALPSRGLGALVGRYAAVVAAAASALLVLDAVPWLLHGLVRGVVAHRTVEDAEQTLGSKLLVPAYFPQAFRWPPVEIRTVSRPSRAAALTLAPAGPGGRSVLIVQSLDGDVPVGDRLLPPGKELHRVAFDLGGSPAVMTDVLLPPDGTFHDVAFVADGRRVVFRFQGDPEEILKMAASLGRSGRP